MIHIYVNIVTVLTGIESHDLGLCVCLWCDAADWRLWWRSSHICCKETSSKSTQHKDKLQWRQHNCFNEKKKIKRYWISKYFSMLFGHMSEILLPLCVACMTRCALPSWRCLRAPWLYFFGFASTHLFIIVWAFYFHRRPWVGWSSWRRGQFFFYCDSPVSLKTNKQLLN